MVTLSSVLTCCCGGDHRVDAELILVLEPDLLGELRLSWAPPGTTRAGRAASSLSTSAGWSEKSFLNSPIAALWSRNVTDLTILSAFSASASWLTCDWRGVDLHEDLELDAVLPLFGAVVDDRRHEQDAAEEEQRDRNRDDACEGHQQVAAQEISVSRVK